MNPKQNFSRSNVNESTLQIAAPNRSSFDLSHRLKSTFKLGVLHPVNVEYLTPSDMFSGSLNPNLQLEKVATPELGRVRMDTHSFVVHARRINHGFIEFIESAQHGAQALMFLPAFDPANVFATIFSILCVNTTATRGTDVTFKSIIDEATTPPTDLDELIGLLIANALYHYQDIVQDSSHDFGYIKDFCHLEFERLSALYDLHTTQPISFPAAIAAIMEPYFGPESIFDAIGYPLFRQYCPAYVALEDALADNTFDFFTEIQSVKFSELFNIATYDKSQKDFTYTSFGLHDEMPLRAIYAAWYDYLRNWHVEKRTNVLDPDKWTNNLVLSPTLSDLYGTMATYIQLLVPRFRMYQRDGLVTIQEDDIYRHVYAPIDIGSQLGAEFGNPFSPDPNGEMVESAVSLALHGLSNNFPFLGNRFNLESASDSNNAYVLDLQTMKRTGMLERYLARDYYNPDTYAGYIRSRFSIVPADIDFLSSVYIGGDEKMIDGSQEVANVSTDATPAGTRTFTGGGSLSDTMSYRASDYGYVVNFVSLMPLVDYDAANMHAHELTPFDMPCPEFATDTRVAIQAKNMLRGMEQYDTIVGYVPRYYGHRVRLDRVSGKYLTDKRSWTWLRDWYNMHLNQADQTEGFVLSPYSLRVHLALDSFLSLQPWDSIAYGAVDIKMVIDRPLPAAVEFI